MILCCEQTACNLHCFPVSLGQLYCLTIHGHLKYYDLVEMFYFLLDLSQSVLPLIPVLVMSFVSLTNLTYLQLILVSFQMAAV